MDQQSKWKTAGIVNSEKNGSVHDIEFCNNSMNVTPTKQRQQNKN